jgi:hypothetical protein
VLILEEIRERNKQRERRLTWELEEDRRKNQKQERSHRGIAVKDRLTREDATMKKLPVRIRPRYRSDSRHCSPVKRAVLKSGVQGEETVAKWPASTVRRASNNHGRCTCTSGTGCLEASVTDYCLRAPGAEKIIVHRFEDLSKLKLKLIGIGRTMSLSE